MIAVPDADVLPPRPKEFKMRSSGLVTTIAIEGAGPGHGTRDMPVWGLGYTIQAAEALPEMRYNQAVYVRTRIMSLLEYLNQLQVK